MSDNAWVLRGVDPGARERATAEAERRGVPLADYLSDIVLQGLVEEQLQADAQTPAGPASESSADRHRLKALERRLGAAVGDLDQAVDDLASRFDDTEELAAETADALARLAEDARREQAALRKRVGDAEEACGAIAEAHDGAVADIATRLDALDQRSENNARLAAGAEHAVAELADAHEALKSALAQDFLDFAHDLSLRSSLGLEAVRATAEAAAEQAQAAGENCIEEMRAAREALELRIGQSEAETRLRMQTAFREATARSDALAVLITDGERRAQRAAEELRVQIADMEDAAQTALEETAEALRQAGAALAAEFARATRENQAAIESVHADLSAEIAGVGERQSACLARQGLTEGAIRTLANDVAGLRQGAEAHAAQIEASVRAHLAEARAASEQRFELLAARQGAGDRSLAELAQRLNVEIERVEACAFAALDKLARDIADVREGQAGGAARLTLLDQAVGALNAAAAALPAQLAQIEASAQQRPIDRSFDERLLRLEAAAESVETEQALQVLREHLAALALRIEEGRHDPALSARMEELRVRLGAAEVQAGETGERVHGVARMLGRLSAQSADAATQCEQRLHKLELSLADVRLDGLAAQSAPLPALQTVQERIAELEHAQADALQMLRADIAHFVGENDRRLLALESGDAPIREAAESAIETLRQRIEERMSGVEQRSVRALEQVADTMAVLEQRLSRPADEGRLAG